MAVARGRRMRSRLYITAEEKRRVKSIVAEVRVLRASRKGEVWVIRAVSRALSCWIGWRPRFGILEVGDILNSETRGGFCKEST